MKKMLSYLLQGTLLVAPVFVTLYVVVALITTFDDKANDLVEVLINTRIPGLGIIMVLAFLTFIGYLSSLFIIKPFFGFIEKLIMNTPGVKIIYSGLKDLITAFASDKKKFDKPVLVNLNHNPHVQRMGFVTQKTMEEFGLQNKVAVYIPHSYNFSGNMIIVDEKEITPLNVSSTDALKFMVSGGVSDID